MPKFKMMVPDWFFEVEAKDEDEAVLRGIEYVQKNIQRDDVIVVDEVKPEQPT